MVRFKNVPREVLVEVSRIAPQFVEGDSIVITLDKKGVDSDKVTQLNTIFSRLGEYNIEVEFSSVPKVVSFKKPDEQTLMFLFDLMVLNYYNIPFRVSKNLNSEKWIKFKSVVLNSRHVVSEVIFGRKYPVFVYEKSNQRFYDIIGIFPGDVVDFVDVHGFVSKHLLRAYSRFVSRVKEPKIFKFRVGVITIVIVVSGGKILKGFLDFTYSRHQEIAHTYSFIVRYSSVRGNIVKHVIVGYGLEHPLLKDRSVVDGVNAPLYSFFVRNRGELMWRYRDFKFFVIIFVKLRQLVVLGVNRKGGESLHYVMGLGLKKISIGRSHIANKCIPCNISSRDILLPFLIKIRNIRVVRSNTKKCSGDTILLCRGGSTLVVKQVDCNGCDTVFMDNNGSLLNDVYVEEEAYLFIIRVNVSRGGRKLRCRHIIVLLSPHDVIIQ